MWENDFFCLGNVTVHVLEDFFLNELPMKELRMRRNEIYPLPRTFQVDLDLNWSRFYIEDLRLNTHLPKNSFVINYFDKIYKNNQLFNDPMNSENQHSFLWFIVYHSKILYHLRDSNMSYFNESESYFILFIE